MTKQTIESLSAFKTTEFLFGMVRAEFRKKSYGNESASGALAKEIRRTAGISEDHENATAAFVLANLIVYTANLTFNWGEVELPDGYRELETLWAMIQNKASYADILAFLVSDALSMDTWLGGDIEDGESWNAALLRVVRERWTPPGWDKSRPLGA